MRVVGNPRVPIPDRVQTITKIVTSKQSSRGGGVKNRISSPLHTTRINEYYKSGLENIDSLAKKFDKK